MMLPIFILIPFFMYVESLMVIEKQSYQIDSGHSFVTFEVKRFDMLDVVSSFRDISGNISLDPENLENTRADILIKTSSLESGNPKRDQAVKGPAFLDVANFPEITFTSSTLRETSGGYLAEGVLTIHGVSRSVTFPVEITGPRKDPTGLTTIAVKGDLDINRQDYGINFDRKLPSGADFIGNDVHIEINVLAVQDE